MMMRKHASHTVRRNLNGKVSWTALTQVLIDAGLPELADNLKDVLMLLRPESQLENLFGRPMR